MRLTWKLALSLAFCWILFGAAVLIKVVQIQDMHRPSSRSTSSELNLTTKLILERARAFRSQLLHFIAVRGNSSLQPSQAMGVFDAVALVQLNHTSVPVRWMEKRLQTPRLTLPESFLARFVLELPFNSIKEDQQFYFSVFKDAKENRGLAVIIPLGPGEYVVGLLAQSFVTALLSDITASNELAWLKVGSDNLSLLEVGLDRIPNSNLLRDDESIHGQAVLGTNLEIYRKNFKDIQRAQDISLWPLIVLLVGFSLISILIHNFFVNAKVPDLIPTSSAPSAKSNFTDQTHYMWALVQRIRTPLVAIGGYLELMKLEQTNSSHLAPLESEVKNLQTVVKEAQQKSLAHEERSEEASLTDIIIQFTSERFPNEITHWPRVPEIPLEAKGFTKFLTQLFEQNDFSTSDLHLELTSSGFIKLSISNIFSTPDWWLAGAKKFVVLNGGEWHFDTLRGELVLQFACVQAAFQSVPESLAFEPESAQEHEFVVDVPSRPIKRTEFPIRRPKIREVSL